MAKGLVPKVSVLMPVYKTDEKYLREAIESILSQTFSDFEFLILDDCPEDPREDVVKSYDDKRIKYFKNEKNLGISLSRNKLIEMAGGEYLAVFDHDDVSSPTRLEKQVQYLDANPIVGVVSCKIRNIVDKKIRSGPINSHNIKLALMGDCAMVHPASMIRKSVLVDNNIRYEKEFSPAEDYALWCRLIPHTQFHNLNDEVLLYYRDHQKNTTHEQWQKMLKATYAIREFVKTENPMLYDEFLSKAERKTWVRLFGLIPLLKLVKRDNRMKIYLFDRILLFTVKCSMNLNEV